MSAHRRELRPGETHVWVSRLDRDEEALSGLEAILSDDELDRAQRFRLPRDRRRSVVSRAVLRLVLGAYTGQEPREVLIACGSHGKPHVTDSPVPLSFNLSHSRELMAVAVTLERRVGIDVEWRRPVAKAERLIRRTFSPAEANAVECAPPEERLSAFFRAWTAREAFLKAIGTGFSSTLGPIEIPLNDGISPIGADLADADRCPARWTFHPLEPAPGYSGTLVIEGNASRPELFELSDGF